MTTININEPTVIEYSKNIEVSGTGQLTIVNTGGSSASEGGMGSGNDEDKATDNISEGNEKHGRTTDHDNDNSFDPIKKSVKEAEKEGHKDL